MSDRVIPDNFAVQKFVTKPKVRHFCLTNFCPIRYTPEAINEAITAKLKSKESGYASSANVTDDTSEIGSTVGADASADEVLKEIRIKNVKRVVIGTLNINSLAPRFEQLKAVIRKNLNILTIQEKKLDSTWFQLPPPHI